MWVQLDFRQIWFLKMSFKYLPFLSIYCPLANSLKNCHIALFSFLNFVLFRTFLLEDDWNRWSASWTLLAAKIRLYYPSSLIDYLSKHKFAHSSSFVNFVSSMPRIWHFRLSHPSMKKLLPLQETFSVTFNSCTDICHICPLVKQKRLPFPFNNNFCASPFDLVHVDIWGPYFVPTYEGFRYFLSIVDDATRST